MIFVHMLRVTWKYPILPRLHQICLESCFKLAFMRNSEIYFVKGMNALTRRHTWFLFESAFNDAEWQSKY